MRELTPERLTRLLAMITYFADGRQVPFAQAAKHFGISEKQLLDDVNTLWVAGAPDTHTRSCSTSKPPPSTRGSSASARASRWIGRCGSPRAKR